MDQNYIHKFSPVCWSKITHFTNPFISKRSSPQFRGNLRGILGKFPFLFGELLLSSYYGCIFGLEGVAENKCQCIFLGFDTCLLSRREIPT